VTSRNGKDTVAHIRLLAVYVADRRGLRLVHFQSVSLPVSSSSRRPSARLSRRSQPCRPHQ
jgi:hypothetical protein